MEKWAVVTGASAGLGVEFAKQLAKRGYKLVLTARREDRLKELAKKLKTECTIITADLSKEEECFRFFEAVKDKPIEVFVNNAGFGDCNHFVESDLTKELDMINVNIKAMHILMKLFLQKMQQEKQGYILNVASCAGLLPAGPYMATYYATKAYVASLTQAVAQELKENASPVYLGALCPGPVNTEFYDVADVVFTLKGISAKRCVRYAVEKMFEQKTVIIPTLLIKLLTTFAPMMPRKLAVAVTAGQQRRKLGK